MDNRRLILYVVAIVVLGWLLSVPIAIRGFPHSAPPPIGTLNGQSVNVSTNFGGSNVNVFSILCAGRVDLAQGSATVKDSCFTGDSNVVICSDITSANAARCEPGKAILTVEGHADDRIAYARVR
jgi:hypothetical protein